MFIKIQKKLNYILLFEIIFNLLLLAGLFYLFELKQWNKAILVIILLLLSIMSYVLFKFLESHLEYIEITRMVKKNQVALAQIIKAKRYKEFKDSKKRVHYIYQLDIYVLTNSGNKIKTKIFESMYSDPNGILPAYVYVTYNGDQSKIGIISNFMLSSSPNLRETIQSYEEKYSPNYVMAVRSNGIELCSVKDYLKRNADAL